MFMNPVEQFKLALVLFNDIVGASVSKKTRQIKPFFRECSQKMNGGLYTMHLKRRLFR